MDQKIRLGLNLNFPPAGGSFGKKIGEFSKISPKIPNKLITKITKTTTYIYTFSSTSTFKLNDSHDSEATPSAYDDEVSPSVVDIPEVLRESRLPVVTLRSTGGSITPLGMASSPAWDGVCAGRGR